MTQVTSDVQRILYVAPRYDDTSLEAWDNSFARRQRYLRNSLTALLLDVPGAGYTGDVGDHTLTLAGVTVHSDNGYAGLLRDWLDAARAEGGEA